MLVDKTTDAKLLVFEKIPNFNGDEFQQLGYGILLEYLEKLIKESPIKTHIFKFSNDRELRSQIETLSGVDDYQDRNLDDVDQDTLDHHSIFDRIKRKEDKVLPAALFVVPNFGIGSKAENFIGFAKSTLNDYFAKISSFFSFLVFGTSDEISDTKTFNLSKTIRTFEDLNTTSNVDIYRDSLKCSIREKQLHESAKILASRLFPSLIIDILGERSKASTDLSANWAREIAKGIKKLGRAKAKLNEEDIVLIKTHLQAFREAQLVITDDVIKILAAARLGQEVKGGNLTALKKQLSVK